LFWGIQNKDEYVSGVIDTVILIRDLTS